MTQKIFKLLYKSFDVPLTERERRQLQKALNDSEQLREEKERIILLRGSIAKERDASFKPLFADRVLQRIWSQGEENELELFFDALIHFFRPIAITAVALVIILSSYNLFRTNQLTSENGLVISEISIEDAFDPMIDYMQE